MSKSNKELNALFVTHVCGCPTRTPPFGEQLYRNGPPEEDKWYPVPDFTDDTNTVLAWLSSLGCWTACYHGDLYSVGIKNHEHPTSYGIDASLTRAAMLAALKLKGVTV